MDVGWMGDGGIGIGEDRDGDTVRNKSQSIPRLVTVQSSKKLYV